jgi:hypothetical protein
MLPPTELIPSSHKEKVFTEDLRLNDPEKHWLQLTSYDLDKIKRVYDLRVRSYSKAGDYPKLSNPLKSTVEFPLR